MWTNSSQKPKPVGTPGRTKRQTYFSFLETRPPSKKMVFNLEGLGSPEPKLRLDKVKICKGLNPTLTCWVLVRQ